MNIILTRSQVIYGNLVETHGPYSRHYTTTYLIYKSNISLHFLNFNPIPEHLYKKIKKSSCKITLTYYSANNLIETLDTFIPY